MARASGPVRRVLVVARWYPAHDDPGRGSFVADQVDLLARIGLEVTVASFEIAFLRGPAADLARMRGEATQAWATAVAMPNATSTPRSWGARRPVARLPVIREPDRREAIPSVAAHREPLLAFGEALARRWPFDLIHAHTGLPDGLAAAGLADRLGVPLVVTEHDSTSPAALRADPAAAAAYRASLVDRGAVVAVSRALADRLAEVTGVPATTIGELANPVALDRFELGSFGGRDPDLLLWVGARRESKGMSVLLRAFAKARRRRPALRLQLIGRSDDPRDEAGWQALADSLGVADAVRFDPPAARSEVAAAMRRAAIFVHPSPWETFGMVAAEALAAGLPVAAMPSGGVPEIVGLDGRYGEIADGADDLALADAIERLLERRTDLDPVLLRRRVEERYAPAVVAARLAERYAAALAAQPTGLARPFPEADTATSQARKVVAGGHGMDRLPLVVASHRSSAVRRMATLPPDLARALTVVTVVEDGDAGRPIGGSVIELDPERAYRERWEALTATGRGGPLGRLAAQLSLPLRIVQRRRLFGKRAKMRMTALGAGIETAWLGASAELPTEERPPGLVCLDAADVIASKRAIKAGARLEPGALRWLADRWDAAGTAHVDAADGELAPPD